MAKLAVDGDKAVYYEDLGAGDTALVLIHGWGMSGRCWDGVIKPLLDSGLRLVNIDHRGCGRSDHDFADLSIGAIASDVVKVVESLGLKSVILTGWSLGGAVATQAASLLGDRCSALVLTAGASPIYTQKPDLPLGGTAEDVAGVVAAMDDDRVTFLAGLAHAVCAKPISDAMLTWMGETFIASAARASSTLGELAHLDQREILLALDMPVLSYICGQDGFVAPEISRWVAENHPRAQGVEFPDSGHAPFIEERPDYLRTLVEFTGSVWGA